MVRVQQAQDFVSGFFPAVALERLHVHSHGVSLAQASRELHFAVDEIIVLDEPADETDDYYGRHRAAHGRGNRLCKACLGKRKDGPEGKDRNANQDTQSTEGGCVDHVKCAFPESIVVGPVFHSVTEIVVAGDVFAGVATLRGDPAPQVPHRNQTFGGASFAYRRSAGFLMVKTAQCDAGLAYSVGAEVLGSRMESRRT